MNNIVSFSDIPKLTKVGTYQVDYPLVDIPSFITRLIADDYYKLQLNPEFQRGHVWTQEQQESYIEYLLRGGTSARTIFFNFPSWQRTATTTYNDFVCVDGLQRLTAVLGFMEDKVKAFGRYYSEFQGKLNTIRDCLTININNLQTEREVLQWYIEINACGTPHTKEEIERVRKMLERLG